MRPLIVARREATSTFCRACTLPGRGHRWSLASRLRSPVEDLESTNANLAYKFSELSKRLSDSQVSPDRAATHRTEIQRRRFMKQWGAEIRHLEGLCQFLLLLSYTELQVTARHGPVIILIVSQHLCSAIIVPMLGEPYNGDSTGVFYAPEEMKKDLQVLLRTVWNEIIPRA
ncbi:hypothetical protein EV702DRAFT_1201624 [Suillus placidus]|uniref:Uncharacterized protein n=1 Tax=Suillus placidus TaxID=48579 RepID=A0A9P6ZMH4_9AGAM|nr:hypothetical protein EV702DRAFT_1201624 [Suillus placidus]